MKYNSDIHHRRSTRLKDYDYSLPGAYFVTICTPNRECVLRHIADGKMIPNDYGDIVRQCWDDIPVHFQGVELDQCVIMPNHLHGVIILYGGKGTSPSPRPKLGQVIAYFKYQSTKKTNTLRRTPGTRFWQRGYHDHIVRNERSLSAIRRYIVDNPMNWTKDPDNPDNR